MRIQCSVLVVAAVTAFALVPETVRACACGCGVFDVGTSAMLPEGVGNLVYVKVDHQDQDRNWHGSSRAPADENEDKDLCSTFYAAGLQVMLDHRWGMELEMPYVDRRFQAAGEEEAADVVTQTWQAPGDARLKALYTGFVPDMSYGVSLGVKLPTGDYTHAPDQVDRDSQVGTGSTDLLLGGFGRRALSDDGIWDGFAQLQVDVPVLEQDHYRPGSEFNVAVGASYNHIPLLNARVLPLAQLVATERTHDSGDNAAQPTASGYQRLLLSPGVQIDVSAVKVYADVEFPVYQHVTGDQLVSAAIYKVVASFRF